MRLKHSKFNLQLKSISRNWRKKKQDFFQKSCVRVFFMFLLSFFTFHSPVFIEKVTKVVLFFCLSNVICSLLKKSTAVKKIWNKKKNSPPHLVNLNIIFFVIFFLCLFGIKLQRKVLEYVGTKIEHWNAREEFA